MGYDSQKLMLQHSQAKIALYKEYLSVYLSILGASKSVEKIYIFDLCCGEGIYEDESKGSPLVALRAIQEHYFKTGRLGPNISVWFNDSELSKLEAGVPIIERVERLCRAVQLPPNVELSFHREEYSDVCPRALATLSTAPRAKGLFFVDPYGYKFTPPSNIREIASNRNAELILFLPASTMYRFCASVQRSSFSGSEPLRSYLEELFNGRVPRFTSVHHFIRAVRDSYKGYLSDLGRHIDTFTLERGQQNTYCLLFFTSHPMGYLKMTEAKWRVDPERGSGFRQALNEHPSFFTEMQAVGYEERLRSFIRSTPKPRTNEELLLFGLQNGFLPKHTAEILKRWRVTEEQFEVISLDGKSVKGMYIGQRDRLVGFRLG